MRSNREDIPGSDRRGVRGRGGAGADGVFGSRFGGRRRRCLGRGVALRERAGDAGHGHAGAYRHVPGHAGTVAHQGHADTGRDRTAERHAGTGRVGGADRRGLPGARRADPGAQPAR